MKKEDALRRAAALCGRQERCISEVKSKLAEWECTAADTELIIERLLLEKFIDEQRFASSFVRSKFRNNKWGRTKIAYMLSQKKIPKCLIEQALLELDEEEYRQVLRDILLQKAKSTKAKSDYDRRVKLFRFAASKGYETEVIAQIIQLEDS